VAHDGAEAWHLLQQAAAPWLAILDWLMPGLNGIDVCRKVRQWDYTPYVYLILLTSKEQQEDIIAGLKAEADDYLIKPFDPQELEARLRAGQRILDLQAALLTSLEQLAQAHQREVEIGAKIQQTLLLGQPPGDLAGAQVAVLTIPSQPVDGDLYDFFQYNARCLDIVVGDVMGKGVPAALLGAAIKSAPLRALSRLLAASAQNALPEPEDIVGLVHRDITRQFISLNVFATLCYGRFDLEQGRLVLVDCGHTKPVCFRHRTGTCEILQGDNMPLGFSEQESYRQAVFPLEAGDMVVFYSDGVTEARNTAGAFFGVDRLMEVIHAQHHLEPEHLIDAIRRAVSAFTETGTWADDLTCVVVRLSETVSACPLVQAQCEVTSAATELVRLRAFVHTFCQELPVRLLDEEGVSQLELAVTEAASNIMRHAYHGRTDQRIQVTADAFADHVCLQLWHHGTAFDPAMVQPPVFDGSRDGGFGVYIIAHCVDEVRYVRDEQGENCICLMKFLMGRSLSNNLYNLGLFTLCQQALRTLGVDLTMVEESERDAALGHGGLGRLAACFLDSLATLDMPGYGYGIHHEYGLFQQEIHNGYQQEIPDNWLASGTPWELERIDEACLIPVYGRIEHALDRDGQYNPMWMDWKILIGVPMICRLWAMVGGP
jgi:serine phosphatase RsbU (regulator of sigma subunit)/anti-sigma regulatory factor (Ser/Thr protein kinase)